MGDERGELLDVAPVQDRDDHARDEKDGKQPGAPATGETGAFPLVPARRRNCCLEAVGVEVEIAHVELRDALQTMPVADRAGG